jgi:uncharacterized protein with von Willebrand factor type A (vWA) domain
MFTDFFYTLRNRKVPITITEWMTLMEALDKNYINNLDDFYYLARAILVKSESLFDQYDIAFSEYFKGIEGPPPIDDKFLDWLEDPINRLILTEEERALYEQHDLEELMRKFEERMKQQTERHDGGGNWVGTGGTSPFGHSGWHPGGIRVGGESQNRHAVKVAQERKFKDYRSDLILDIRQIKLALKGLRQLSRIGAEDELDLEETIDETCKNAGEIELIFKRSRKNAAKVLLMMDVGGSMDPFAMLCSRLFTAAHASSHFKDFQYYYFHNCVYDHVYKNAHMLEGISTDYLIHTLPPDYKVIFVGDARMATSELTMKNGIINYYMRNDLPGILWLKKFTDHFTHCVWLNPEDEYYWNHPTVKMINVLFPMYPLTVEGISDAVRKLIVKK